MEKGGFPSGGIGFPMISYHFTSGTMIPNRIHFRKMLIPQDPILTSNSKVPLFTVQENLRNPYKTLLKLGILRL